MNTKTLVISAGAALGLLLLAMPVQAEVVNNSHWLVKSGDTVYSIARKMYPNNVKKQVRFRRELVKANPEVFTAGANLMRVGSKLALPRSAISQYSKKPALKTPRIAQLPAKPVTKVPTKSAVVTADPVDVIGKVVIKTGNLQAVNRSASRQLSRHSKIIKGDTLKTSRNSLAQIRMKDGALISLQPDTEFKIEEYAFNGEEDGNERSIFELVKGGFRTITGLIGHKNKQNYQVRTTVATIGIRGTHYGLMLCQGGSCQNDANGNLPDGLHGGVIDGSIVTNNGSGQQMFNNDQFFHVATSNTPAIEKLTPPPVLAKNNTGPVPRSAPLRETPDGQPAPLRPLGGTLPPLLAGTDGPLPTGPLAGPLPDDKPLLDPVAGLKAPLGAGMVFAFNYTDTINSQQDGVAGGLIVDFNGNNEITLIPSQQTEVPFTATEIAVDPVAQEFNTHQLLISDTAVLNDFGTHTLPDNTNIIWGRWTGGFDARENGTSLTNADPNMHFVYSDVITPPAYLGGLTSTSTTYVASKISVPIGAATLPTDSLGGVGSPGNFYMSMTMNFDIGAMTNYSLITSTPNMDINAEAVRIDDLGNITRNVNIPLNYYEPTNFHIADIAGTSCTGSSTCTGHASVAFVGTQADGVITSYTLTDPDGTITTSGAAFAEAGTLPQ